MLADRRDQNHAVQAEGKGLQRLAFGLHADEAHIEEAIQKTVNHALAVILADIEIDSRIKLAEGRQDLGQDIGGGDGGSPQADDRIFGCRAGSEQTVMQVQDLPGFLEDLEPLDSGFDPFAVPEDQSCSELLFEEADVCADRGL